MALATEMLKKGALRALCMAGLMLAGASQATEADDAAIAERIKPVGEVCVQGDPCAEAVASTDAGAGGRSGEEVYTASCAACHGSGILGAPKKDDGADWQARMDKVGGFDKLLEHAITGINSMPAKGSCGACSDEELASAIEFMSGLSK